MRGELTVMPTRTLLCLLALSVMSAMPAMPASPIEPVPATPTEIVRQFLEARTAGQGDKMQALVSQTTPLIPGYSGRLNIDAQDFSGGATPAQAAVLSLLYDPQNKIGFKFLLLDAEPEFPNIVRVQADPAVGPPVTLQVVVEPDSSASDALRVDELLTVNCADPRIMLPIVERPRSNMNRAASQQHLQQFAVALIEYAQDHDATLPEAAHWVDALTSYVKDPAVFHNPAAPASQKWGYAFNKNLSGKILSMLQVPAGTVAFFESAAGVKNASDTGQSVPVPGYCAGGTDYGLADGSVRWFPDGTKPSYQLSGK